MDPIFCDTTLEVMRNTVFALKSTHQPLISLLNLNLSGVQARPYVDMLYVVASQLSVV